MVSEDFFSFSCYKSKKDSKDKPIGYFCCHNPWQPEFHQPQTLNSLSYLMMLYVKFDHICPTDNIDTILL